MPTVQRMHQCHVQGSSYSGAPRLAVSTLSSSLSCFSHSTRLPLTIPRQVRVTLVLRVFFYDKVLEAKGRPCHVQGRGNVGDRQWSGHSVTNQIECILSPTTIVIVLPCTDDRGGALSVTGSIVTP